jgi:hypothetical protein
VSKDNRVTQAEFVCVACGYTANADVVGQAKVLRPGGHKVFGAADDHRLVFAAEQFDGFQAGIRAGEPFGHCVKITVNDDGPHVFGSAVPQPGLAGATRLEFTDGELLAFYDGVIAREFDEAAFAA